MGLRIMVGPLALGAALVSLLITGCGARKGAESAASEQAQEEIAPVVVARAATGSIRQVELLTGSVEGWREVDVQAEVAGKVSWVGYDVGDRVSSGAALVRLDTALATASEKQSAAAEAAARARLGQTRVGLGLTRDETAISVLQAEKNVEAARNRLAQAKTSLRLTRSRVEDGVAQARLGVSSAKTRLEEVKAGSRGQEIAQAEARLEQAKASVRLARVNLTRNENLAKDGAVSASQLDAAQVEYETSLAQQRIAEQALDLAKEGARTQQAQLAELAVSQAERTLQEAEAQRGQVEVAERDVRSAELAVAQAEDALRLARSQQRRTQATEQDVRAAGAGVRQAAAGTRFSRAQLGKHVVYAPVSGIVAARHVEPGEGASPGVSLVRLVVLDPVRVVAVTSELQVSKLRVGQTAEVTVDGLAGERFAGVITDIPPQAGEDSRNFSVRLRVANSGRRLRAGMFARIGVVTGLSAEATLVPRDALVERGEQRVVYVVRDGQVKVRKVRVGAIEGVKVQVLAGLRPGDMVVLQGQNALADGQKVTPQDQPPQGTPQAAGGAEAEPAKAAGSY